MNNDARKKIKELTATLSELQSKLQDAHGEIETLRDDEQGKFDNMTDALQQNEKGQAIEQAAETLSTATDEAQTALDSLEAAISALDEIE